MRCRPAPLPRAPGPGGCRAALPILLGAMLWPCLAAPADTPSPLVAELREVSTHYHENPARLDAIRDGLERAVSADAGVANLVALAQVSFIWGDVRAATPGQKVEAYDRGREAGQRAVAQDPKNPAAHFWFAVNSGRWAETRGVLRALFMLPTIKEEVRTILDLDPGFTAVYALAGNMFAEVPGPFGGDLGEAEAMFRRGLAQDPKFTGLRVGLGKTLIRQGRIAEARRELQAVLDEREPTNPADWTVKDIPEARRFLDSIRNRS
jgi:tetratricopeptide repeat protein